MRAIDIHVHAFPDDLAGRAISQLESLAQWQAALDGRVGSLLASMDAAGIDVSVVCPIATKPEQTEGILRWCAEIRSERIEAFPSIHPAVEGPQQWLRRIAQAGFAGIKLHPMYQDFVADEPRMIDLYAAAMELGLTVLLHCGHDIAFPAGGDRAGPERVRNIIAGLPYLELIATHMGGWRMWDESRHWLVGSRCYLETSFSLEALGPDQAVAMIRAHGPDRVLFGSDSPWTHQKQELARLRDLPLTKAELEKILHANAERILGI